MARTTLTIQQLVGPYPDPLNLTNLTFAAADVANMNDFVFTGRELIIARNTDASTRNVTLTSIKDDLNRVGNVTRALLTNEFAIFEALKLSGWLQSDGKFYLQADHANVLFAIVRLKSV
jgi:hypothetical protein